MKLLEILQGKWLGHPLHPALVHLPIGAWVGACLLDLGLWLGWGGALLARLALVLVAAGLLGALVAVPPGLADWIGIKKEKPAWRLGLWHLALNLVAVLVWAVNCGLRIAATPPASAPVLLSSLTGTALILISGYLGSRMVFDHGISVARQSKEKWRAMAARGGARLPEES